MPDRPRPTYNIMTFVTKYRELALVIDQQGWCWGFTKWGSRIHICIPPKKCVNLHIIVQCKHQPWINHKVTIIFICWSTNNFMRLLATQVTTTFSSCSGWLLIYDILHKFPEIHKKFTEIEATYTNVNILKVWHFLGNPTFFFYYSQ